MLGRAACASTAGFLGSGLPFVLPGLPLCFFGFFLAGWAISSGEPATFSPLGTELRLEALVQDGVR